MLGALLLPTPAEAEQSRAARGNLCCIAATQCPVVKCRLAFGNHRFSQVQRSSAEDSSLFSFNMKEGNTCLCAVWLFL